MSISNSYRSLPLHHEGRSSSAIDKNHLQHRRFAKFQTLRLDNLGDLARTFSFVDFRVFRDYECAIGSLKGNATVLDCDPCRPLLKKGSQTEAKREGNHNPVGNRFEGSGTTINFVLGARLSTPLWLNLRETGVSRCLALCQQDDCGSCEE